MQRYFISKQKGPSFFLTKEDSHHIVNVMRMQKNDCIEVVQDEKLYLCQITHLDPIETEVVIQKEIEVDPELPVEVILVQSLVKEAKMDFILQKAVELGVSKILPLETTRSVVKLNDKKEQKKTRWQKILKEAAEQSKRVHLPQILDPITIDKLCQINADVKVLCTVNETSITLKTVLQNLQKGAKLIIVIGPEGGFEKREEQKLIQSGFQSTSLGNFVLRTETAGLYVMSILNYYFMR